MKIGVISDTHGNLFAWNRVFEYLKNCDYIIHCGDVLAPGPKNPIPDGYDPPGLTSAINNLKIPIFIAKGNCDSEVDSILLKPPIATPYVVLQDEKNRIIATHGHIQFDPKIFGARIFITGHTHIPNLEEKEDIIYLNPGSPSVPLNKEKTFAIIEDERITIFNLDGKIISNL
ncbi:TPA: phosphodiesterase [bacterium]|nr:phosphodiesterase [bacterium]